MRLLLLNCASRKRGDAGELPAIERYDGPMYRMLRRVRRDGLWPEDTRVLILSAEFGLLDAEQPIPDYDRLLDAERASEISRAVARALDERLRELRPTEVAAALTQRYLPLVQPVLAHLPGGIVLRRITGRPGEMMSQVKRWLLRT